MGVTKSQTRLSDFHYVKRITRSLIEIQSGDQKGALSHPVRTEEPKKEGKKDSLLRKDSANEKTGTLLPRALPHCTQPVTLMAIIKEYRSRWEYLRGTQDNKKGSMREQGAPSSPDPHRPHRGTAAAQPQGPPGWFQRGETGEPGYCQPVTWVLPQSSPEAQKLWELAAWGTEGFAS